MKKSLFVLALLAATVPAWAQETAKPITKERLEAMIKRAQQTQVAAAKYEERLQGKDLQMENRLFGSDGRAKQLRQGVMDYLGIKPQEGTLYIFVSASMPRPIIEAYLNEGIWSGAILVQRGLPEGMTLNQWAREWYQPFMRDGKPTATITIDPVLFDQFAIKEVPTILWDENPQRLIGGDCDTEEVEKSAGSKKQIRISTCKPFGPEGVYRMSGAVTVDYALGEFVKAGSKSAEKRLSRMKAYFTHGSTKEQTAFGEDWSSYLSEEGLRRVEAMTASIRGIEDAQIQRMEPLFEDDQPRADLFSEHHYPIPDAFKRPVLGPSPVDQQ